MEITYQRKEISFVDCKVKKTRLNTFSLPKGTKIIKWNPDEILISYFKTPITLSRKDGWQSYHMSLSMEGPYDNSFSIEIKDNSLSYYETFAETIISAIQHFKIKVNYKIRTCIKKSLRSSISSLKISDLETQTCPYTNFCSFSISLWGIENPKCFEVTYSFERDDFFLHIDKEPKFFHTSKNLDSIINRIRLTIKSGTECTSPPIF